MAGSLNMVQLIGNLGADPEIRRTQDGRAIANFTVATSESWRDRSSGERKEKTEWHKVVVFNEGLAKIADQYLKKGAKVYVQGQLQTRKWQDKDGVDRYSTEVILQGFGSTLSMLDSRSGNGGGDDRREDSRSSGGYGEQSGRGDSRGNGGARPGNGGSSSFSRDMDDDIPFAPEWR